MMPTPPPEIDVELWLGSIAAIRERGPETLRLTHFGAIEDAAEAPRRRRGGAAGARPSWPATRVRTRSSPNSAPASTPTTGAAERMRQAMPLDQMYAGLERYWRKRAEASEAAIRRDLSGAPVFPLPMPEILRDPSRRPATLRAR